MNTTVLKMTKTVKSHFSILCAEKYALAQGPHVETSRRTAVGIYANGLGLDEQEP